MVFDGAIQFVSRIPTDFHGSLFLCKRGDRKQIELQVTPECQFPIAIKWKVHSSFSQRSKTHVFVPMLMYLVDHPTNRK